jgi:hypothetical protein
VVGEAGPWRQLFADISAELQAADSPLLIACPNHDTKVRTSSQTKSQMSFLKSPLISTNNRDEQIEQISSSLKKSGERQLPILYLPHDIRGSSLCSLLSDW